MGEKNEVDQIQAYCEHICADFQNFFNRWTKVATSFRVNYSLPEINRKFKYLAKRDITGYQSSVKDYNMMVDEIMGLTGSYTARTKGPRTPVRQEPDPFQMSVTQKQPPIFHEAPFQTIPQTIPESRPIASYSNIGQTSTGPFTGGDNNKGFSRLTSLDFNADPGFFKIPSTLYTTLRKDPSMSQLMANLPMTTRQPSYTNFDDMINKRVKEENNNTHNVPNLQNQPSLFRDSSSLRFPDLQPSFSTVFRQEDFSNLNLPTLPLLSKKSSVLSQGPPDDLLPLSRFQSNLSFLYDNNNK